MATTPPDLRFSANETLMILNNAKQNKLAYAGEASADKYFGELRHNTGLSVGRVDILIGIVAGFGIRRVRSSTDDGLQAIFHQYLAPVSGLGFGSGSILGLTHTSIVPDVLDTTPVVETDARGSRVLSSNGLRAIRSIAANFNDSRIPDIDQLRVDLASLREQVEQLHDIGQNTRERDAPTIGHNHPPEDQQLEWSTTNLDEALASISAAEVEVNKPNAVDAADPQALIQVGLSLRKLAAKIGGWIGAAGKLLAKGVLGEIGKEAWQNPEALASKMKHVGDVLLSWAEYLKEGL